MSSISTSSKSPALIFLIHLSRAGRWPSSWGWISEVSSFLSTSSCPFSRINDMQEWPNRYKSSGLQFKINSIAATGVLRRIKPMVLKANLWIWFNLSLAHWYTSLFDQQTDAYVKVGLINALYHNSCVFGRQPFMDDIKFAVRHIVLLARAVVIRKCSVKNRFLSKFSPKCFMVWTILIGFPFKTAVYWFILSQ